MDALRRLVPGLGSPAKMDDDPEHQRHKEQLTAVLDGADGSLQPELAPEEDGSLEGEA